MHFIASILFYFFFLLLEEQLACDFLGIVHWCRVSIHNEYVLHLCTTSEYNCCTSVYRIFWICPEGGTWGAWNSPPPNLISHSKYNPNYPKVWLAFSQWMWHITCVTYLSLCRGLWVRIACWFSYFQMWPHSVEFLAYCTDIRQNIFSGILNKMVVWVFKRRHSDPEIVNI